MIVKLTPEEVEAVVLTLAPSLKVFKLGPGKFPPLTTQTQNGIEVKIDAEVVPDGH